MNKLLNHIERLLTILFAALIIFLMIPPVVTFIEIIWLSLDVILLFLFVAIMVWFWIWFCQDRVEF